jgi:hypothetical protein
MALGLVAYYLILRFFNNDTAANGRVNHVWDTIAPRVQRAA